MLPVVKMIITQTFKMANWCQNVRGNKTNKDQNDNKKQTNKQNKKQNKTTTTKQEEGAGVEKANNISTTTPRAESHDLLTIHHLVLIQ